MDQKKSPNRRSKRQTKVSEDSFWDCSVCTYRNTAEAFKCLMCDVRKGTSTRKPRINPQLVAQQVAQQYNQATPKVSKRDGLSSKTDPGSPGGSTVGGGSSMDATDVTIGDVSAGDLSGGDEGRPAGRKSADEGAATSTLIITPTGHLDKTAGPLATSGGGILCEPGGGGGGGGDLGLVIEKKSGTSAGVTEKRGGTSGGATKGGTGLAGAIGKGGTLSGTIGKGGVLASAASKSGSGFADNVVKGGTVVVGCPGKGGASATGAASEGTNGKRGHDVGSRTGAVGTKSETSKVGGSGVGGGRAEHYRGGSGGGGDVAKGTSGGRGGGAVALGFAGAAAPVAGNGIGGLGMAASDFPAVPGGLDIGMLRGGGGGGGGQDVMVSVGGAAVGGLGARPSPLNNFPPPPSLRVDKKSNSMHNDGKPSRKARRLTYPSRPKLKNIDRSSAQHKAVTVNNVTVIITEFQPKRHQSASATAAAAAASSDNNHHHHGHSSPAAASVAAAGAMGGPHGPHAASHRNGVAPGAVQQNGNHSDSTNLSNDSHSDGRSS